MCLFLRYTEFQHEKKSRNSAKFRGISRNYTSRNSAEFRRNFSQFRTEYGIDGSEKNRRNSVSTEFRGHPISLAGRYDNPLPIRFLAPIDSLKIPAQVLHS